MKNFNSQSKRRKSKSRALVAMSGGVDSSVTASLLVEEGYDVIGVTMQVWDYSSSHQKEGKGTCCSSSDVDDARSVAEHLNIPFYVMNCESQFQTHVIDNFVQSYLKGETPIPCIHCNTFLKFDHLITKMKELDCDFLATGHYAKLSFQPQTPRGKKLKRQEKLKPTILTSSDDLKDQTYFLFTLHPHILPFLKFPLGEWDKTQVRDYAKKKGLPVALKKDSTGICFIGKEGYARFIEKEISNSPSSPLESKNQSRFKSGPFRKYPSGEILGRHNGIHSFTYGQRRGLGISSPHPLYVIQIEAKNNTVWLGEEKDLFKKDVWIQNTNFLDKIQNKEKLQVKIRFSHKGASALVSKEGNLLHVKFDQAQRAITPGQAAVFYRDNQLVGGGWILNQPHSIEPLSKIEKK